MLPASAEFMNSPRITFAAYGTRSRRYPHSARWQSPAARTGPSRHVSACAACNQSARFSVESCGIGRIIAANARASATLSASVKACAVISFGSPCSGAGKPRRPQLRTPPARLDHRHLAGPVNLVRNADAPIEAHQIGAAAEQHMLAVVDHLAHARMQIRRWPVRPGSRAAQRVARANPASARAQAALIPATPAADDSNRLCLIPFCLQSFNVNPPPAPSPCASARQPGSRSFSPSAR